MTHWAEVLTIDQAAAMKVIVAAETGKPDRRPVRASNRTTHTWDTGRHEMLKVQHNIADQLVTAGLVRVTNDVLRTLELTDQGRKLAEETGLA